MGLLLFVISLLRHLSKYVNFTRFYAGRGCGVVNPLPSIFNDHVSSTLPISTRTLHSESCPSYSLSIT